MPLRSCQTCLVYSSLARLAFPRSEYDCRPRRLVRRGGQGLERAGDFAMREVGGEKRQTPRFVAVRMDQHDRAAAGLLPQREPGVSAERNQVELAHRLHQRIAGDEAGEAEE